MKIQIIGKRLTSRLNKKTGQRVTDCVIHFTYEDKSVEGKAVATKWVGANYRSPNQIIVGNQYELEEFNNFVIKLAPIENAN
ncbi:MAG: hypothetical protein ACOX6O_10570 [Christensenellales bacterium]|jgi:hypothetical protein